MSVDLVPPPHSCNALAYDLLEEALRALGATGPLQEAPRAPVPLVAPAPPLAAPILLSHAGGRPRYWSSPAATAALRAFAETHGRVPTGAEWRHPTRFGLPDPAFVRRTWGTFDACYLALGLTPNPHGRGEHWTAATATRALRAFVHAHGRMPTTREWRQASRHGIPDEQFIRVVWGTFGAFFRRLGLTPRPRGVRQTPYTPRTRSAR